MNEEQPRQAVKWREDFVQVQKGLRRVQRAQFVLIIILILTLGLWVLGLNFQAFESTRKLGDFIISEGVVVGACAGYLLFTFGITFYYSMKVYRAAGGKITFLDAFYWGFAKLGWSCPYCGKLIQNDVEWRCARCDCINKNTHLLENPFLGTCEYFVCKQAPTAFRCYHEGCEQIIFLDENKSAQYCAEHPGMRQQREARDKEATKSESDGIKRARAIVKEMLETRAGVEALKKEAKAAGCSKTEIQQMVADYNAVAEAGRMSQE